MSRATDIRLALNLSLPKGQPIFTTTSMCHSVNYVYAHCNRARNTTLSPCEAGYDRSSGCNAGQFTTQIIKITAPSLCPNCYRAREAKICEEAKTESNEIRETIEEAVADMHRANGLHARVLALCTDSEELTMQEIRIHTRRIQSLDEIIVGHQVSLLQARTSFSLSCFLSVEKLTCKLYRSCSKI